MKQLRLTTTKPYPMFDTLFGGSKNPQLLVIPEDLGELDQKVSPHGKQAYLKGKAEKLAGFDLPVFLDGTIAMLDAPIEEQDILLLLPGGNWPLVATYQDNKNRWDSHCYYLTLKK